MTKDNTLVPFQKEVSTLATLATNLIIESKDDMVVAVSVLSKLNKVGDQIEERKEMITKPINLALKEARALFAPLERPFKEAIAILRDKMSVYQTETIRLQREQEIKIANRVISGNIKVETGVRKIEELEKTEKNVSTEAGSVNFRVSKILRITDETLIPREYLMVDEKKLLDALKEGVIVAGAEIEERQVPANFR